MGAGNYLPSREMGDHRLVYVDGQFGEDEYQALIDTIRASLPKSFDKENRWVVHNAKVIARSTLLDVCVADNEWSEAVFLVPTEGLVEYPSEMNLAYHHLDRLAENLFRKLKEAGYTLRVRSGPWTSGEYTFSDIGKSPVVGGKKVKQ
jgi:hypothetical protein